MDKIYPLICHEWIVMSRLHDERRGVLTGSSIGRSVHHTVPQSMEKEKLDNTSFPSHAFGKYYFYSLILSPH